MQDQPVQRRPLVIAFFAIFAGIVILGLGRVLAEFITPILLGGFIAVLTFGWYRRLRTKLKGRATQAAIIMILGVVFVIILPLTLLVMLMVEQAAGVVKLIQETDVQTLLSRIRVTDHLARFAPWVNLQNLNLEKSVIDLIRRIPALVASHGAFVVAGFANLIVGFFFMLFATFYFYTEGEKLVAEIKYLSPLPDRYDDEMIQKFKSVVDATFRGHMLTALAQGAVTGVGLAIASVPGSLFWGAVAAVFALLPLVGAGIVWAPAAIYLFAVGRPGWAVFMLIWGIGPVSLVDNLIRPWAMRGGTHMSAVLLLFSVLGGVKAFGFLGLLLGPLLFALFVSIVDIYKKFFEDTLEAQNESGGAAG